MSGGGGASIAGVLEAIEKHGTAVLGARDVEALAPVGARAALHAAGVIRGAAAATSWPCDVRGCAREIQSSHAGARRPLVAVCCQAPPECMPVELGFDDVAQQELSADGLVLAACALLGASVDRAAPAKLRERRPLGDSRAPVAVGAIAERPDLTRDVFWARSPRDTDLAAFCARRERLPRATLVLVPTPKHVPLDVAARHARGEHVEVRALADWLHVADGRLAPRDRRRLELVAPPADEGPLAPVVAPGIAAQLGATRWEDIRLERVDGHTLRIEASGRAMLRTFVELGFIDGRKKDIVPTTAWALLLLFCERGRIKPSAYAAMGKAFAAKKAIERLGEGMRAAFGLEEHPIHSYSKRSKLWEARFRIAAPDAPDRKHPGPI